MELLGYVGVAILLFYFIHLWWYNRNKPIPYWPIIGMLPGILHNMSNIHDYVTRILKYNGGTFKFEGPWLLNVNFVITSDPMNVHHITSKKFDNYGKGSEYHDIFEILGDGIFNSDFEEWKYQRAILHSCFKKKSFESFVQQIIWKKLEICLLPFLSDVSRAGTQVDLQDILQRFTFDNTCSMVLGFDPNCLPNQFIELSEVAHEKAFSKIEDAILYRYFTPRYIRELQKWLRIGYEKEFNKSQQVIEQFLHDCITFRREKQPKSSNSQVDESNFDFLKALMEEGGKEQKDDKFMRDTAINLLSAGRNTISAGLSWFFWLVSTHPIVEAKIIEEIKDTFITKEANWSTLGVEELNKLVYLHGAVCETLRLFPPVPFDPKCAFKSDTLPSGDRIDPNTVLVYSLYSMGRMEETWGKDCLEFKPERWISEKGSKIYIPSYKFIAFNAGPRSCLGRNISFIQMKMVAIALLWNFKVQVVEGHHVSPTASIILHMKHGLKVNVTKRCI